MHERISRYLVVRFARCRSRKVTRSQSSFLLSVGSKSNGCFVLRGIRARADWSRRRNPPFWREDANHEQQSGRASRAIRQKLSCCVIPRGARRSRDACSVPEEMGVAAWEQLAGSRHSGG